MLGHREVSEAGGVRGGGEEGVLRFLEVRGHLGGESILFNGPGKMTSEDKSSAGLPQLRSGPAGR